MIGVIADDLTGSGDVGLHFADCGLKTLIQVVHADSSAGLDEESVKGCGDAEVFIINTDSRFDKPKTAYDKVRVACGKLKSLNANRIYKKIDSTLRGNLGSEIDALFDEFDMEALPFCAAFPSMGRTTVKGRHYVRGELITKTEFAKDPRNPVKESHIPTLLESQTKNHQWIVVCNAKTDDDVKNFAREVEESELTVVAGAAGLAGEMSKLWTGKSPSVKKPKTTGASAGEVNGQGQLTLMVSGSRNPVTFDQIDKLKESSDIMLVPINFSGNKVSIMNWLDSGQAGGKSMVIYSDRKSGKVSPDKVMKVLSRLARKLCEGGLFKNLVLAGGDTAMHVCRELNIDALKVESSVLPGVASCRDVEGRYNVILKPGGFGERDILTECLEYYKH